MKKIPDVVTNKGFARVCESVFPRSRTSQGAPEGWTEGPLNVPDGGGVLEGGACPPLH
jgi:hypothetical protein